MYVLSCTEEQRILAAAAAHLKPIIRMALNTGMRKSEILNLRWRQVDLRRRVITLNADDSKSKRPDTVPLNSEMIELLTNLPQNGPYVFGGEKPLGEVKKAFQGALKRANLPREIRFHDLRHTFGTRLAALNVDAATIMKLMRHRSLDMVMRYVHPAEQSKRNAVELLLALPTKVPTVYDVVHREPRVALGTDSAQVVAFEPDNKREKISPRSGSNQRHPHYECGALPTELRGLISKASSKPSPDLSRRLTLYQEPVEFPKQSCALSQSLSLRWRRLQAHFSAPLTPLKPPCVLHVLPGRAGCGPSLSGADGIPFAHNGLIRVPRLAPGLSSSHIPRVRQGLREWH